MSIAGPPGLLAGHQEAFAQISRVFVAKKELPLPGPTEGCVVNFLLSIACELSRGAQRLFIIYF